MKRRKSSIAVLVFLLSSLSPHRSWADGHSPAFAFSTATLGAGDASIETAFMWRSDTIMFGPRFSYGIRPNLQISFSSPFHVDHGDHPTGRFMAMMPGNPEAEVLMGWRFYHASPSVGTRNEATLYAGASDLTQHAPRIDGPPLLREPGMYVALAAGRVARSYDIWAGVGYQRYGHWESGVSDRQSSTLLSSLALGWRPKLLNKDYPKPDVRFFWETTGESVGFARRGVRPPLSVGSGGFGGHTHDALVYIPPVSSNGILLRNSGGTAAFTGPSFLCTYRSVAFQGGVLFALLDQPNGTQVRENVRAMFGVSYYFLGRRK